jgi:hypothetical protein
MLIEAAWNNRFKAQISRCLEVRQEGQPKAIRQISWKAQLRLSKRWRSLAIGRKLNQNKICVAIARELSGFVWDVARHIALKPQSPTWPTTGRRSSSTHQQAPHSATHPIGNAMRGTDEGNPRRF